MPFSVNWIERSSDIFDGASVEGDDKSFHPHLPPDDPHLVHVFSSNEESPTMKKKEKKNRKMRKMKRMRPRRIIETPTCSAIPIEEFDERLNGEKPGVRLEDRSFKIKQ
jgi:hypothetical protein